MTFSYRELVKLVGGRMGEFNVPCPLCGPACRTLAHRQKKVLKIWHRNEGFAGFYCVRCGTKGHVLDRNRNRSVYWEQIKADRAKVAEQDRIEAAQKLRKARWLWSRRRPVRGSIAEKYLREARGYPGPLPKTLGFLPAYKDYPPSLICSYGIPIEPEPGILAIPDENVRGVQLTRLLPDGSARELGYDARKTIGRPNAVPMALAPINDHLGLIITEGVEDALSLHEATGLGAWAAGGCRRMLGLASVVPDYVTWVTIQADDDHVGQRASAELSAALRGRGIDTRIFTPGLRSRGE